jgi:methionine-rich copper-binding protein CopC
VEEAERRRRRSGIAPALLIAAGLASAMAAPRVGLAGHGGVVQLNRASAGPYAVSVWTQSPPRPGSWQVDVAVMREDGAPVADAAVRVRAEPLATPAQGVEADARREADPLGVRYRTSLVLGAAGAWRVTVVVTGPAGPGVLTFPVDVERATGGWWPGVLLGVGGLALAAALLRSWRRRRLAGVAGALLLVAMPAWPHASLVRSSPARRATLAQAPDRVQLWFNEAIEPRFSSVSVWDAAGQQVDLRDARVESEDPQHLTVGLTPLKRGTYRVRFRVLSVDGHVVESEFSFALR